MRETCVEYIAGEKTLTWCSSEPKYMNRIRTLAVERPEEVRVVTDDEYGVCAHVPISWVRAPVPKRKREMTVEQRAAAAERLARARKEKMSDKQSRN